MHKKVDSDGQNKLKRRAKLKVAQEVPRLGVILR